MSEWITDRKPKFEDAPYGKVWVMQFGAVLLADRQNVDNQTPWMPITPPEPYVKPKRWTVRYHDNYRTWVIYDSQASVFHVQLNGLDRNDDEHREAAERIAAIYEEVMP